MDKELKNVVKQVIAAKAVKLLAEASEILSSIEDGDIYEHAFSHAIMALAVLSPGVPMPTELAATLKKYGITPNSRLVEGAELELEYAKIAALCQCSDCTARRQTSKQQNAPSTDTPQ